MANSTPESQTSTPMDHGLLNLPLAKRGNIDAQLEVCPSQVNGGTHEANARLIAAAPDLYEALQSIAAVVSNDSLEEVKTIARAALAKVRPDPSST